MNHYFFIENNCGEQFIVGADTLEEAKIMAEGIAADIAEYYGEEPDLSYEYEMTDEEAEASGLDEY